MARKNVPENERWEPCPPGELARMVGRSRLAKQKKAAVRGGIVSAAVLLLIVSIWQFSPNSGGSPATNFGGITCSEVHAAIPDLLNGVLDEPAAKKVTDHLAKCGKCRKEAEKMGWVAVLRHEACEDATCTHCRQRAELIARGILSPDQAPSHLAMARASSAKTAGK